MRPAPLLLAGLLLVPSIAAAQAAELPPDSRTVGRPRKTLLGLGIGIAVGVIVGANGGCTSGDPPHGESTFCLPYELTVPLAAGLGAAIGWLVRPDVWEPLATDGA